MRCTSSSNPVASWRFTDGVQTVVADVTDRTDANSERGLFALAFSGDGARAYLHYTDLSGDTVVDEYPVAADGRFDLDARRVVITLDQPYSNHHGGDLAIGPDGMLLIALGDGGSGGDPSGAPATRPPCSARCCGSTPGPMATSRTRFPMTTRS